MMAGIIEAVATVTEIFGSVNSETTGKDLLKIIGSKKMSLIKSDGSMLRLLGNYIVEPVCVITKDLKENEITDKLVGLHADMFTGFYMQALDVLRYMNGMSTSDAIDILATGNGGVGRTVLRGAEIALEDRDTDYLDALLSDDFVLSIEDVQDDKLKLDERKFKYQRRADAVNRARDKRKFKHQVDKDGFEIQARGEQTAYDRGRDRVGKDLDIKATGLAESHRDLLIPNALIRTVEVSISNTSSEGRTTTVIIPVMIKTQIIYTDADNIINAMAPNSNDKSFLSRLDDYKSSAVSFLDFMFASDLVKKYKNNKLKDKDDLLKLLQSRKISSNSKYADLGAAGFEKYYTMYLISKPTAIKVENFLRGKLKSNKYKEQFLTQAYGLAVTVVDEDYERIQMHLKDIKGSSDLTFKAVIKNDKNDSGMGEVVKALMSNTPPVF